MGFGGWNARALDGPWNVREIRKQHDAFLAAHDRLLFETASELGDNAVKNARDQKVLKNRTFALRNGWKKAIRPISGGYQTRLLSRVPHAFFHEKGTGLWGPSHSRIVPRRAKYLRWVSPDGVVHFAKSVKGVPPKWIGKKSAFTSWADGRVKFKRSAMRLAKHF